MSNDLSRRDFLKLAALLSGNIALPPFLRVQRPSQPVQPGRKNVLIIVFDAFSAYNISLYGYRRETTPFLARLAERAIVYHNHFAAGNFTTPGTASLLTGVYPWTHRAFKLNQRVAKSLATRSIFHAFKDYYRIVYSHNPLVNTLFDQFQSALDNYIPINQLLLTTDGLIQTVFHNDDDISNLSWLRTIKKTVNGGYSYSLFLSDFYKIHLADQIAEAQKPFPLGLPFIRDDNYYVLDQAIDFLGSQLHGIPQPFLGYFHFFPPHEPYRTRIDFYNHFENDHYQPVDKPEDIFGRKRMTRHLLERLRTRYDDYILYVDREFDRFFRHLEETGLLENTWLVLTSDHGELFERAIWEHSTPVLYQPVVRVPLIIFEPGRESRTDISSPTSAVDLLPTLLHVTGSPAIDWSEGVVMPPFTRASFDHNRSLYAIEAKYNSPQAALTEATIMLVKGQHKLTYFFGYPEFDAGSERVELYDLQADPEELNDLYSTEAKLGKELLDEIKAKLAEVNAPYL